MLRALTLLLNLLMGFAAVAHEQPIEMIEGELPLTRLTSKIYVIHGPQVFPNPQTRGFMNNPGFVVTDTGVVVVDPGSSVHIGRKVIDSIKTVTDLPVLAVFNTHVHGDHWLGNQAMVEAYPDINIYGHKNMISQIKAGEGQRWIDLFNQMTSGATIETAVVPPTVGLQGGEEITIGGTLFTVHHPGKAHSNSDLIIEVINEKSVFAGDILTSQRIQSARPQEGDIVGQISAVKTLLDSENAIFIPGHGHSGGREIVRDHLVFLTELHRLVRSYFQQGLEAFEMTPRIKKDLSSYRDWHNFEEIGRVVDAVYLRIEQEWFQQTRD